MPANAELRNPLLRSLAIYPSFVCRLVCLLSPAQLGFIAAYRALAMASEARAAGGLA